MRFYLIIILLFSLHSVLGQKIISHKQSSCDKNSYPDFMKERIVSKTVQNDTLDLTIGFSANCCVEIRPVVIYENDTLFLYNKPQKPDSLGDLEVVMCMCDCCFEFKMQISGISDTNFVFLFDSQELKTSSEKYRTFPVRFNIDQGDTINRIDKYGFRQGVWRIYNQGTNTIQKEIYYKTTFYKEDDYLWIKTYRPNGTLEKYTEVDPKTGKRTSYNSTEYKELIKARKGEKKRSFDSSINSGEPKLMGTRLRNREERNKKSR